MRDRGGSIIGGDTMDTADTITENRPDIRKTGGFILSALSGGHGVFHWFQQSFVVMLPEVQDAFRLSEVAVGAVAATREITSGLVTLPGGFIADRLMRHWGTVLALCMGAFGFGWLLMGLSPVYPLLLAGMAVVGMASSLWHLPATASLSHRFPRTRGAAFSFHSVGGQIGDAVAPPLTGFLLGVLTWRGIISIYAVAPLFLAFLVVWALRGIGQSDQEDSHQPGLGAQVEATRRLLRNRVLWGITLVVSVAVSLALRVVMSPSKAVKLQSFALTAKILPPLLASVTPPALVPRPPNPIASMLAPVSSDVLSTSTSPTNQSADWVVVILTRASNMTFRPVANCQQPPFAVI